MNEERDFAIAMDVLVLLGKIAQELERIRQCMELRDRTRVMNLNDHIRGR